MYEEWKDKDGFIELFKTLKNKSSLKHKLQKEAQDVI